MCLGRLHRGIDDCHRRQEKLRRVVYGDKQGLVHLRAGLRRQIESPRCVNVVGVGEGVGACAKYSCFVHSLALRKKSVSPRVFLHNRYVNWNSYYQVLTYTRTSPINRSLPGFVLRGPQG